MLAGIDRGRSAVKAVTGGREPLIFPALASPGRDRRLKSDGHGLALLEAEVDGHRYFIGELAGSEGGAALTVERNVAAHEDTAPLVLVAAALLATESFEDVRLVVGLQVADFKPDAKATYRELLAGRHTVSAAGRRTHLRISDVAVAPQGGGALFGAILDDAGRVAQPGAAGQTVAVLDIGYRDVNLCVIDRLHYVDRLSTSFPMGLHEAFVGASRDLSDELGYDVLPQDVPRHAAGRLEATVPHLQSLAKRILDLAGHFWAAPGRFDRILLAGGGAPPLAPFIQRAWPRAEVVPEPQLANARGFYRLGRMQWP